MQRAASCTSSSGSGPFIAANTPPMRTSGRQSSQSIVMRATARDVTTSKLSRSALFLGTSGKACDVPETDRIAHLLLERHALLETVDERDVRVRREDRRDKSGNPAPEPMSAAVLPERRTYRSSAALSRKCRRAVASPRWR